MTTAPISPSDSNDSCRADDEKFMSLALAQARAAEALGEVPVGAIVVHDGKVIATGHNNPVGHTDPTAHAEVVALRAAATALGNYRLEDCDLYVTLEPCAMCTGAMLHARLRTVVFGAKEPKTGAMGSVIDLPSNAQLNHRTVVRSGVMALECGAMLTRFFKGRREQSKNAHPLREDALRTSDSAFSDLLGYDWSPNYVSDLPALGGLRLHYIDEGTPDGLTFLCLHGEASWSYEYRALIEEVVRRGYRVVAPDFIGFGRSDKPKKESAHSLAWHCEILQGLIERLDLKNVVLVGDGWGEQIGVLTMANMSDRFSGFLKIGELLATEDAPWRNAPFPDNGHKAGPRAVGRLVPEPAESPLALKAHAFLRERWSGRIIDDRDVGTLEAAIDFFKS